MEYQEETTLLHKVVGRKNMRLAPSLPGKTLIKNMMTQITKPGAPGLPCLTMPYVNRILLRPQRRRRQPNQESRAIYYLKYTKLAAYDKYLRTGVRLRAYGYPYVAGKSGYTGEAHLVVGRRGSGG